MFGMSLTPPPQGIQLHILLHHHQVTRVLTVYLPLPYRVVIKVTSMEGALHHLQLHLLFGLTTSTTTTMVLVAHPSSEAVWLLSVAAAFWTNVASRDSWTEFASCSENSISVLAPFFFNSQK